MQWSQNRTGEISLHKMGLHSTCAEQFPGRRSWIKSRISLDYSLWWPLRVLSWGYLKHSPTTLRPAQRRLQGFGPFERFKVQAFTALITHSAYAWEAGLVHGAYLVVMMEGSKVFFTGRICFSWWLILSCWSHYTLISCHELSDSLTLSPEAVSDLYTFTLDSCSARLQSRRWHLRNIRISSMWVP